VTAMAETWDDLPEQPGLEPLPDGGRAKACTCCGRQYDRAHWNTLPFVGVQHAAGEEYELRNCTHDPTRGGRRCVYGYWLPPTE